MSNLQWPPEPSGPALQALLDEMHRQVEDARGSFAEAGEVAVRLATSAQRTGRLLLLGMGGSHAVNRVAEACYRKVGLDATALPVSEMLHAPIPPSARTSLLTSQSGESGEIVAYLATEAGMEERFGMTLNAGSALGRAVPCLIGLGGMEHAFAATRSLYLSLALHSRVLQALGMAQDGSFSSGTPIDGAAIDTAVSAFAKVHAVIFSGRAAMQGIAESAALGLMELARMPALALEGGQLRHGPPEALGPAIGVVFIRQEGDDSAASLALLALDAGSPVVVFDMSGTEPVLGTVTIPLPPATDMQAAIGLLPHLQRFQIENARRRVADVGAPVRSTKVTRET